MLDRENIHDDVDMDSIMEMVDDSLMEDIAADSPTEEVQEIEEVVEPVKVKKEEDDNNARLYREALRQNQELQQALESTTIAKEQAESIALQSAIRGFETQINYANSDIERLKSELVKARDEGDTASSVEIENKIREDFEYIRDLKGKIDQYSPLLNAPKTTPPRQNIQQDNSTNLAEEWIRENSSWLTDPKYADKKEYADKIFKDLQSSNHDISNLSFWTKFEKSLAEYDHKGSNNKSQSRMPKNMVTYNSNSSANNNTNKQSYKNNPEFVQKVAYLVKNVIKNDDALKDKNMVNSMLKHYYKVYREGGFKHMPATLN